MVLSDLHQLYLQSCMSRRVYSEKTGAVIFQRCIAASNMADREAPDFGEFLDEINQAMEPFGFEIKRFQDEHSGKAWQAFVNNKSDELAKVATDYGPQEISYFRTLIKLIMKSGRKYSISSNEAKRAGSRSSVHPPLPPTQAEAVLSTFVARGWFIIVSVPVTGGRSEKYQLSSRARMELENYLTEEYPKQTDKNFECIICNEVVFKGKQCKTNQCKMRMHDHCARSLISRNGNASRNECPKCKEPFSIERAIVIGPESTSNTKDWSSDEESGVEEEEGEQAASTPRDSSRKRKKGVAADSGQPQRRTQRDPLEEDEEEKDELAGGNEDEEEQEEEEPRPSTSRRKSSRRGGSPEQEEEEEEEEDEVDED